MICDNYIGAADQKEKQIESNSVPHFKTNTTKEKYSLDPQQNRSRKCIRMISNHFVWPLIAKEFSTRNESVYGLE